MEQLRLFISLPVDAGLSKKINRQFNQLELPWDSLRLVLPEQMHLTLKFLGAVPLDKLPLVIQTLESIPSSGESIELLLDQAVATPSHHPEIIGIRIQENIQLTELYQKIEQALFAAGLANLENRRYSPHLTLARIKKSFDPNEFSSLKDWKLKEHFTASYFSLVQSELTPRGPIYTILQSFDL